MTFWVGLLIGWIVGSIGTGVVLMFFAGIRRDDEYDDYASKDRWG